MFFGYLAGIFAALGIAYRIYFMRTQEDVFRGPHLHDRLDALFDPYVGQTLDQDAIRTLQAQADELFRDIITGVGLVPDGWTVLVHIDEMLGPVPRLTGPDGELLHIADFEQRLRDGRIDLSED
jgi:hypothetical protein